LLGFFLIRGLVEDRKMAGPCLESGRFDHVGNAKVNIQVFQNVVISDKCTHTVTSRNQAVIFQDTQSFADDCPGNTEHFAQLCLGGELAPGPKGAAQNRLAEFLQGYFSEGLSFGFR
jgi:hypothetical protein